MIKTKLIKNYYKS